MSTGGNRFGPPYLSAVLGEAKKRTGKQVVTDFRGQGFIPILVAGICNPAGPTLTIFSFSKPDESGESWLCEHMLNPFQTSFHRMTKVRSADIGLTAEGMNDGGRDQALLAFADVHLTQDQSFTPGTFHTYCPAVSRTATESALLAWMEQSDSTPRDLDDLTRLPYKSDHLSRATFARIQERIADRRQPSAELATRLLRTALDPSQQAMERQAIIQGWDIAQARAPGLGVVTTTREIKEVFTLVAGPITASGTTLPVTPSPWDDPTKGGKLNPKINELDRELDEAARQRAHRALQRTEALEAKRVSKGPVKNPLRAPKDTPSDSWLSRWSELSQELSRRAGYERSGHWLEVWAQLKDGSSLQGGHHVEKWADQAAALAGQGCSLGLIALRQATPSVQGRPGVTFVLAGPTGGSPVARHLMSIFARHGLGGALADVEENGRWALVKYLYTPHWYAKAGDLTFGVDWSDYDQATSNHDEGRLLWCRGVETAIRDALNEFPARIVDALFFDTYDLHDRLELLTPSQWMTLRKTHHAKLGDLLAQPSIPAAGFWDKLWG